jgi:hypothetical protein
MPEEFRDSVSDSGGDPLNDAVDLGSSAAVAPEPDRRTTRTRKDGQPWGKRTAGGKPTGAGKEKVKGSVDLSSLTGMFVGLHVVASQSLQVPELAMDMAEGQQFMSSAQNVLRHYSVETTQKTLDWIAFAGTCCMIYGTRFGAYMVRKAGERNAERPTATVYPMPPRREAPQPQASQQAQHFPVEMDFEGDA